MGVPRRLVFSPFIFHMFRYDMDDASETLQTVRWVINMSVMTDLRAFKQQPGGISEGSSKANSYGTFLRHVSLRDVKHYLLYGLIFS